MKNNLDLHVSSILWVHPEFSNEVYFKYTLKLFLKCICISFLTQKYTWSILSEFANWHSNVEVYLSILFELIHYFQTQKYTWGGLSKLMYLGSNSEVTWSKLSKLMHLFSNSEVHLKKTFYAYVFLFKLTGIFEVDFLNNVFL